MMVKPEKVFNGTFGELWIDDYYLAEVTGLEAKISLEKPQYVQSCQNSQIRKQMERSALSLQGARLMS